jgi:hypothetical protein
VLAVSGSGNGGGGRQQQRPPRHRSLSWKKLSDYAIEDATGKFRVCRARVRDVWVYIAWQRVTAMQEPEEGDMPGAQWEPMCYSSDLAVAKAACETALSNAA